MVRVASITGRLPRRDKGDFRLWLSQRYGKSLPFFLALKLLRLRFPQAKEAELLQINKILEDSDLTAAKYHQWKEHNEELVQEIEKAAKAKASKEKDGSPVRDTPPPSPQPPPLPSSPPPQEAATEAAPPTPETEGAYRLNLSDGEQLVDTPKASSSPDSSPVLELSIGSLQDSINKELNELGVCGDGAENYFYI